MDRRPFIPPPIIIVLLVLEAFFLTYIYTGAIDLVYILITFGISVFFIFILLKVYSVYKKPLELLPDPNENRSGEKFSRQLWGSAWKEGVPIWGMFLLRIILTITLLLAHAELYFIYLLILFLDAVDSKFISLARNNTWMVADSVVGALCNTILFFAYATILWVVICFVLSWILNVFIYADLRYLQLRAFIPNIYLTLAFYTAPAFHVWLLPVCIAYFLYDFYEYELI
jgi:hypothetical protein